MNAGVSENCMLGHLVPQGTGSFDLLLNHVMLRDAHEMSEFLRAPVQSNAYVEPNAASVVVQGQVVAISPLSDFHQVETFWSPSGSAISPGQYYSILLFIFSHGVYCFELVAMLTCFPYCFELVAMLTCFP